MFFNLLICKLKHLQSIWVSRLRCFSFSKVVDYSLIGECLFDVIVCKKYYQVSIRISFTTHTICKYHLLFSRLINPLNLTVMTDNLLDYLLIFSRLLMILIWKFQTVILLNFLICCVLLFINTDFIFFFVLEVTNIVINGWLLWEACFFRFSFLLIESVSVVSLFLVSDIWRLWWSYNLWFLIFCSIL